MSEKFNVLITGGAGFIGTNLVQSLVSEGHHVTVFDNFSHCKIIPKERENVKIFNGDMLDEEALKKATENQDYIVHLAAQKSVDQSIREPVISTKQNVLGLVTLLHSAVKNKVKRVFFASTAAVYGYNDHFPLKESETLDPQSPYSLEKIVGEQYLSLFYKLYGLDGASMRFFNVYGPMQYSSAPHCGGVTIVMNEFLKVKQSNMLGDGTQTRDMIYVGDVVDAIMRAMKAKGPLKGDVYNVCTGTRITIAHLQRETAKAMGIPSEEISFKHLPFADGNVVHSQGDPTKAKEVFGFEAKTSLQEGLKLTWEWFKQNPNFYT